MSTQPARDEIARRAYFLYIARNRQHGADVDDWLHAERQLTSETKPPQGKRRSAAKGLARARPR